MAQLSTTDFFAAAAGQPTSRELTLEDLKLIAGYKKKCRESLFQPPCECSICLCQYRTKLEQECIYWRYLDHAHNPASLARSFALSITEDREFLFEKIISSGTSLLKRWRNSEAKRKIYLEKVDIYPVSQPLIDIASRIKLLPEARKHKNAYLLPYINIEDLSKSSTYLIRLLHFRTILPPEEFVHFDNAQMQPGWKHGGLSEKSAEGCIIMHGEQYGIWKDFDRQAVHNGDAYGAIRGLLILEAQQVLMSFLRKTVCTILDVSATKPESHHPEAPKTSLAPAAFPYYDLSSCCKWMRFIEADPHQNQAWLSVASVYTQQSYSSPPCFDIDSMIEIAETKAMEAGDELWLLQTDLDYFHELLKYHERTWIDSMPGVEKLKTFSPTEKLDNIGYLMTVKMVVQARNWQWLLDECRAVKKQMEMPDAKARLGEPLPVDYKRALCGLRYLLQKAQTWYQESLLRRFMKSPAFQSIMQVTAVGKDHRASWALGFNFKDYPQLYRKDRTGWCLYNLAKDPRDPYSFERSVVLQHLENYLETCPRQEVGRIDQEMYKCISDMAAVERMLSILGLHRPNFAYLAQTPFSQPIQTWRVQLLEPSKLTCADMGLGSALELSARFRMPTGKRDEQWLSQRDQAQQALNDLWTKARHVYQVMLKASEVSQSLIEPQLAIMKQGVSPEFMDELDRERQQILGRLQTVRQRALAKSVIPHKDTASSLSTPRDQPAHQVQVPAKEKIKTRPEAPSASASLHAKYAAAFAKLVVDDELRETEKPPPVLYTLKHKSIPFQVIALMFPDRSNGIEEGGKTVEWLDFLSTMKTLGFAVEHRGGSAFTFKGAIRIPSDHLTLQKRSISVHMPHPSTEMSPILLQSLGRRCNRRFGWQRANFSVEDASIW